ncbi:MAG: hypothetical protein C0403_13615, partial [Desulfobacterium sp.]|nr:hypothetical protein [Desulfobacterium sp.]
MADQFKLQNKGPNMNIKKFLNCFIAKGLLLFIALQGIAFTSAHAEASFPNGEQGIFGPKQYLRTTGSPNIYEDTFSATPGPGYLIIRNCEADSKHRVTSALIFINGEQIYEPKDFKQDVYILGLPVVLDKINTIRVELRSKPGTYLTIGIGQMLPTVHLTADPSTIILGASATLSWNSGMANTCIIDPGIGEVDVNGFMTVSPTVTTTYTITATAPAGSATASATVTVISPPTVSMSTPLDTIVKGESTLLSWTSAHADTCVIEPGVGAVDVNGTTVISPAESTTYTITATGPGGVATSTVNITVLHPPTVTLSATPATIFEGETATLNWTSVNGNTAILNQGIGQVQVNGSAQVTPDKTRQYTITVTGNGGITTATTTVIVKHHEPIVSITANPETILSGNSTVLTWASSNTHSCVITPGIGSVDPAGTATISPSETTTYTITGSNPDNSASASVTVQVNHEVDIQPINIDMTGTAVDGQTLNLTGTVKVDITNNGLSAVHEPYEVTLFEDSNFNNTYDSGEDQVIGNTTLSSGPGVDETVTVSIDVDATVTFKGSLLFAFVDSGKQVFETNEENNIINSMATCEYVPPVGSFKPALEWEWKKSSISPSSDQVVVTPAVANLTDDNNDGIIDQMDIPAIIFVTHTGDNCDTNGRLRAIHGDGSGEIFTVTGYDIYGTCSPAVGDIDNDGLMDILVMEESGKRMLAFDNQGKLKWASPALNVTSGGSSVTISDLDTDGNPEIIYGRIVLNNDGSKKWTGTGGTGVYNSIAADINLDGFPEVIAGNTVYSHTGQILWQNSAVGNGYTAVANFDEDPFPELVVVSSGYVYLLEHTGQIIWGPIDFPPSGRNRDHGGPPTIADFDSDGQPEIGIAGGYRYVVMEGNGKVRWSAAIQDTSSNVTGSSVFDFEGDGSAEVVYADEMYLFIFRGTTGAQLFKTRIGSRTRTEYPIIVDVDNDNNAEIVVPSNSYHGGYKTGIQVFGDANDT